MDLHATTILVDGESLVLADVSDAERAELEHALDVMDRIANREGIPRKVIGTRPELSSREAAYLHNQRRLVEGADTTTGRANAVATTEELWRRYRKYYAQCALDARSPLNYAEWLECDAILNDGASSRSASKAIARGPVTGPAQLEFDKKVREAMAADQKLKMGDAVILVQKKYPALSERVWQESLPKRKDDA